MTTYYCSSVSGLAANLGDGSTWAQAKITLTAALALATVAGDIILIDSAHVVSAGGALTYNLPTATTTFVSVISVNRNGSVTTGHAGWLAGAKESIGTTAQIFSIATTAGTIQNIFFYGMTFECATGSGASDVFQIAHSNVCSVYFDSCSFNMLGTRAGGFQVGLIGYSNPITFRGCNFALTNTVTGSPFSIHCANVVINGCTVSFAGANKPVTMFTFTGPRSSAGLKIIDSDMSGFNAGNYISVTTLNSDVLFRNCKLGTTLATGTWPSNAGSITVINCDTADTHNVFSYRNRLGTLTQDGATYADLGAKFDSAGISWQIVTTALCNEGEPFITPWLQRWSTDIAAITAGLHVANNGTTYTNKNLWQEIEYLASATFPNGTLAGGRVATPFDTGTGSTAAANWATDSNTWTGAGGFTLQKLESAITTAEKSLLRGRLFVAAASKTLSLDPLLWISTRTDTGNVVWVDGGSVQSQAGGGGGGTISQSLIAGGA